MVDPRVPRDRDLNVYLIGTSKNFSTPLTHIDALYFDLTTFSTVGYGDITAKSQLARVLVSAQLTLDILLLVVVIGLFVSRLASNQPRDIE